MSALALVAHQFRFDQKAFWRNPAAVFFTVMFPVVVFLILAIVFDGSTVAVKGGIEATTYYVPAIMTLSVISATMQTLAMTLVIAREDGRLKRGRGTPMPAWVFIAGRIGNSIVVAVMMMALHIWAEAHGIASLFARGDEARRPIPMTPEDLLDAAVLIYLDGLGVRKV